MKQTQSMNDLCNTIDSLNVSPKVRKLHVHTQMVLEDAVKDNESELTADDFYALACLVASQDTHDTCDAFVSAITESMTRAIAGLMVGLYLDGIVHLMGVDTARLAQAQADAKEAA